MPTDGETVVKVDGEAAKLDDLRAEMRVRVQYVVVRGCPGLVKQVLVTSKNLEGAVLKVEGTSITIKSHVSTEGERTVETDGKTQFLKAVGKGKYEEIKLEDIKPKMGVRVTPEMGLVKKVVVIY
jgi:hypothetical protein